MENSEYESNLEIRVALPYGISVLDISANGKY